MPPLNLTYFLSVCVCLSVPLSGAQSEDKAFFATLPWGGQHLRFLHVASRFYLGLIHCPEGRHFMKNGEGKNDR